MHAHVYMTSSFTYGAGVHLYVYIYIYVYYIAALPTHCWRIYINVYFGWIQHSQKSNHAIKETKKTSTQINLNTVKMAH